MSRQEELEQVKATIETVARFDERERLDHSPFHLSACGGCGAPSFQQPCSLCGYYPYGADRGTWFPKKASFADFAIMVRKSGPGGQNGTIATWHARSRFKGRVDMTEEQAKAAGENAAVRASGFECCEIQTVWDVVSGRKVAVAREPERLYVNWGWSGFFEARAVAQGSYAMNGGDAECAAAVREAAGAWVDAVHGEDMDGMASALEDVLEACRMMDARLGRSGNLSAAHDYLCKAKEAVEMAAPGIRA